MGFYRLLLAIAVLVGHLGLNYRGHAQGVSAVVSFFLLSGWVMTALIRRNYNSVDRVGTFYLDRAMRLFPQYLLYVALTLAAIGLLGVQIPSATEISPLSVAMNALMVPMGFYMIGFGNAMLIPQSWSLGLEFTFYLVFPFVLLYRLERPAFIVSIAVFLLAYLRVIDTDIWGYRLLPGTLFFFLCGSFLYQASAQRIAALITTYVGIVVMFAALQGAPQLLSPWNYEVLQGFIIGLPIIALLARRKFGSLDGLLGNISYGVYLNHFLIIWTLKRFGVAVDTPMHALIVVACSLALAWVSYSIVERPVIAYRRAIRREAVMQAPEAPPA